jgi:hypothetical protein
MNNIKYYKCQSTHSIDVFIVGNIYKEINSYLINKEGNQHGCSANSSSFNFKLVTEEEYNKQEGIINKSNYYFY